MSLAKKIHDAYSNYGKLEWELFEAIEAIAGEDNVEDSHVECDSVYDGSVEIVMADGVALTDEHRKQILALGFARIWCDGSYPRKITLAARAAELAQLRAELAEVKAEREALREAVAEMGCRCIGGTCIVCRCRAALQEPAP